jgi:serine/threonine protein kinase
MGEVYRARDTKLGRDVALKVVAESVTHDPERVARFRREAQLLASLNHPHIATIDGLEEAHPSIRSASSGSTVSSVEPSTSSGQAALHFLAMELVEGAALAERLKAGPIPTVTTSGSAALTLQGTTATSPSRPTVHAFTRLVPVR